ncbi:MAG: lysoplasmalogenase, partial [Nocardioides sp.]|nr:lysoplasmalogenase [Nocardioides sp.]
YDAANLAEPTKWLLVPLLAATLLVETSAPRTRLVTTVLVALGLSWLGDVLPQFADGDAAFLIMVGCFLLAQLTFIAAFRPYAGSSILTVGRVLLLPYAAVIVALIVLCAPGAGGLLVPVLIYGACLGAMAVLATGVNGLVWAGGTTFLVSDALIALEAFSDRISVPHNDFAVMLTYVVAQLLIVLGTIEKQREG